MYTSSWNIIKTIPLKASVLCLLFFWIYPICKTISCKNASYMKKLNFFTLLSKSGVSKFKSSQCNKGALQFRCDRILCITANTLKIRLQKKFFKVGRHFVDSRTPFKFLYVCPSKTRKVFSCHQLPPVALIDSVSTCSTQRALLVVTSAKMEIVDEKKKPLVVFVLGGPGCGKGTQCKNIADAYHFIHISAGDCLREEQNIPGSAYGKMIATAIHEGAIVPAQVTIMLLRKKMIKAGWEKCRFLIDGFPRNQENLDEWLRVMENDVDVRFCLFLDCNEKEMTARLLSRAKELGRIDDNVETIQKRLNLYNKETYQIIRWFEDQNKTKHVDASGTRDAVWKQLQKIFAEL